VHSLGAGQPPVEARQGAVERDLGGALVLPGLADSHVHIYALGKQRRSVDLTGCRSIEELQARLRKSVEQSGAMDATTLLEGTGWDQNLLGRDPTRADLDAVVGDRPAIIHRRCWHAATASSAALRFCGALAEVPEVDGGVVERDASGPTGVLRERAIETVLKPLLELEEPAELQKEILHQGLMECVRRGITQVQSNDGKQLGNIANPWKVYSELEAEGKLPCRVFLTVPYKEAGNGLQPGGKKEHPSGLLSCHRVKLWTDGALGASTAAMLEPYSDDPEGKNLGVLQISPEEISEAVSGAKAKGLRIEAHTIGDRSAKVLLDAFEQHLSPADRPLLTHCQILNDDLVAQMAAVGAIANVQPQFVPSDLPIVKERLGADTERFRYAYAWRTLLRRGVRLAGGSDSPVEEPAPLVGMADAMDHVLHEGERLTFAEALEIYTAGAAYAAGAEDRLGRLEPGMAADLVVVHAPGMSSGTASKLPDSKTLREAQVMEVYVQGRRVHAGSALPPGVPAPFGAAAGKGGLIGRWRRGRCPCCRSRSPRWPRARAAR